MIDVTEDEEDKKKFESSRHVALLKKFSPRVSSFPMHEEFSTKVFVLTIARNLFTVGDIETNSNKSRE